MTRTRPVSALLLVFAVLAGFVACERAVGVMEIPAQSYATVLDAIGEDWGTIEGQVLFPSEYSQRSVVLRIDDLPFVTQPDGRFRIVRVPIGPHRFEIAAIGFEPLNIGIQVGSDSPTQLNGVRLAVARGRVFGRLVHLDGESAGGISLRLDPAGASTETDDDGIFQFVGVPGGSHEMVINHPDYYTKALRFALPSGETHNLGVLNVFRRAGASSENLTSSRDSR